MTPPDRASETAAAAAEQPSLDMGPLENDIGFQIHITKRAIWAALRPPRGMKRRKKPSGYISTLLLVAGNPGVSPSQIAQALTIDMPNVVVIMRMLEEENLIERRSHPSDGRRVTLFLTDAGEVRCAEIIAMNESHSRKIGSKLTPAERATLVELLGKVRASVFSSAEGNDQA